jgi:hypothetical protein
MKVLAVVLGIFIGTIIGGIVLYIYTKITK